MQLHSNCFPSSLPKVFDISFKLTSYRFFQRGFGLRKKRQVQNRWTIGCDTTAHKTSSFSSVTSLASQRKHDTTLLAERSPNKIIVTQTVSQRDGFTKQVAQNQTTRAGYIMPVTSNQTQRPPLTHRIIKTLRTRRPQQRGAH